MLYIKSKENNNIKLLTKLQNDKKYRAKLKLFFVEGKRIVADTPHSLIYKIFIDEEILYKFINKNSFDFSKTEFIKKDILINKIDRNENEALVNVLNDVNDDDIYILAHSLFEKIKLTINSQGIAALIKFLDIDELPDLSKDNEIINFYKKNNNLILILDNIGDPGNLGTIIRTAVAFNVFMVIITRDSCDIYNEKVLRASMSSMFKINIYISNDIVKDIETLKKYDFKVYATTLSNESKKLGYVDFYKNTCIIVGNEGSGIKDEIINIAHEKIIIPMSKKIESLNVSVATSIVLYEINKENEINKS